MLACLAGVARKREPGEADRGAFLVVGPRTLDVDVRADDAFVMDRGQLEPVADPERTGTAVGAVVAETADQLQDPGPLGITLGS